MRYREFENQIKQSLEEDEAELDIGALQASIQTRMERKRRYLIIWIVGLGLGFASILGLWLTRNNYEFMNTADLQVNRKEKAVSVRNYTSTQINLKKEVLSNTPNISINDKVENTIEKTDLIVPQSQSSKIYDHNQIQSPSPIVQEKNTNSINFEKEILALKNNTMVSENLEKNSSDNNRLVETESNKDVINDGRSSQKTNEGGHDFKAQLFLPFLPQYSIGKVNSMNEMKFKSKEIICPTFGKRSNIVLSLIPEIGYFIPKKKLEVKQPDLPNGVFSLRYDNEQSLEGISVGAHLKVSRNDLPYYIKGGVVMSRIAEKMRLSYTTIKRDTTIGIISITKSPSGDTITTIYGPIIKETETSGINTKHYYLHLFDIPVSIGIEQKIGGFKLNAEVGAAFNVGLSSTGNILTTDDKYEDVKQGGRFRSSIGINYFGSFGVEMPVNEKLSLQANLRGRYLPTDFTRADGTISQRYNTIGVNIGMVYSLSQ
jgi:hypothetical protein